VKIHHLGTKYTSRKHRLCDDYVRSIRAVHLANTKERYVDIAYTAVVCEYGVTFEGRGTHKLPDATGNAKLDRRETTRCAPCSAPRAHRVAGCPAAQAA
jgi:hypothetical protein